MPASGERKIIKCGAAFPLLAFFCAVVLIPNLHAEQSNLELFLGASRGGQDSASRLRSDLSWEQSFLDEALLFRSSVTSLSILSESRDFAYSFQLTPVFGLGRHFEGGPTLSFEKEVLRSEHSFFAGARLQFSLWSLRFHSGVDASLKSFADGRLLRLKQQILLPLGSGERREDYAGLSFQFEESLGDDNVGARTNSGRIVGLVFMSSIEDLF